MAERVLVTGGAGFIGAHLVRQLLATGAEVTVLDDLSRGRRDATMAELASNARFVRHDLTQPIPQRLLPERVETVFHLAAVVGVQRTAQDPARVLRANIAATANLLDWCDHHGPETIFLSSTSEIADGATRTGLAGFPTPEAVPFVLAEPAAARSSYPLGKLASENMLLYRAGHYRVRIGRYFNVYGRRMGYSHVIPQFIERMLAGEDPFRIYGAHQSRAFCNVEDAVAATIGLSALPGSEPIVANIGDDSREIQILDLARLLFTLAGIDPRVLILDPPANSPQRRLPDLSVLRALLPARQPVPLETGLRQVLDWYGSVPR